MTSCTDITSDTVYAKVIRGDSRRLKIDLDAAGGTEVDITGWLWLCQLRDAAGALVLPITVMPTDPVNGVLEWSLTAAQTGGLTPGDYDWDLQGTDAGANVRTVITGKLRVYADVSHT